MADSVTASALASLNITSLTTETAGASTRIAIRLPSGNTAAEFTSGTGGAQVSKMFTSQISLTASTPVTLDLTALTGGVGDTAFTKTKIVAVYNNEAIGSGKAVTIGAAASTPHTFALGGT